MSNLVVPSSRLGQTSLSSKLRPSSSTKQPWKHLQKSATNTSTLKVKKRCGTTSTKLTRPLKKTSLPGKDPMTNSLMAMKCLINTSVKTWSNTLRKPVSSSRTGTSETLPSR